jgi:hypothetical protein
MFSSNQKKEVPALQKEDLHILLAKWELLDAFKQGKIKCEYCTDVLDEKNLGAFFNQGGEVGFCCSKLECLSQLQK